jgi:periplasmic divalent cation tolerance protein
MAGSSGATVLLVTCPGVAIAEAIAGRLLGARLAASANIVPCAHSLYWWQGRIERADETLLIVKTATALAAAATAAIVAEHPYDTPSVIALDIAGGNRRYLDWLLAEADGRGDPAADRA